MTGINNYSGSTVVSGGTLQLNTGNGSRGQLFGTPTIAVGSGGVLALNAGDVLGYINGEEVLVINSGVVANIASGSRVTIQNLLTMSGGTLTGTGAGDGNGVYSFDNGAAGISATSDANGNPAVISAAISPQNTSLVFNVTRGSTAPPSDLNVTGAIIPFRSTSYGIVKSGNGIMTLTASETYTGSTSVNGGTLAFGSISIASVRQSLGSLAFAGPDGTLQSTLGASGSESLTFSSLTARTAGNTGIVSISGGTNGANNKIVITGQAAGFIDQGTFYGGGNYAYDDPAGYLRGINYGSDAGSFAYAGGTSLTGTYVQTTGAVSAQATAAFATLNISGAYNVTQASGGTLSLGGLLKSGGGISTISNGSLTPSSSNGEFVILRRSGQRRDGDQFAHPGQRRQRRDEIGPGARDSVGCRRLDRHDLCQRRYFAGPSQERRRALRGQPRSHAQDRLLIRQRLRQHEHEDLRQRHGIHRGSLLRRRNAIQRPGRVPIARTRPR